MRTRSDSARSSPPELCCDIPNGPYAQPGHIARVCAGCEMQSLYSDPCAPPRPASEAPLPDGQSSSAVDRRGRRMQSRRYSSLVSEALPNLMLVDKELLR